MGNKTGDPYVMNTNVWASGDGKKEHQFYLWFDPAADYHTYKIVWNPKNIMYASIHPCQFVRMFLLIRFDSDGEKNGRFEVDGVPVRTFKKYDDLPYPSSRPMTVHATLWDGSYWATRHGDVKIHWRGEPFVVAYRGYRADGCVHKGSASRCPAGSDAWMRRELGADELRTVAWAERNCLSYNYCADGWRFPKGFPGECARNVTV